MTFKKKEFPRWRGDTRKRKRKQAGKGKEETESCRTESDRCLLVWNM